MPAAVVGLALVGGGVVTAATLSYVAIGITVAGMVTKNKSLLKIGGQLGLAAGVSGIASSFMSGAGETVASSVSDVASAAVEDADMFGGAVTGVGTSEPAAGLMTTDGVVPFKEPPKLQMGDINSTVNPPPVEDVDTGPGIDRGAVPLKSPSPGAAADTKAGLLGTPQGADLGSTQGAGAGQELGSTQGTTQLQGKSGSFFDFLKDKDGTYNKQLITEGGKIIAGGIQGLNTTSVENTKLAEARRLTDIQRANAASVGKSNYGILRS